MGTNEVILQKLQSVIETVRGTDYPTTRKAYANVTMNFERPIQEFSDTSGSFDADRRVAYQRATVTGTATDLVTFEDLPYWGQGMFKGGVAGVTDAGTPPAYTYTFQPSPATDDIASYRFEFNESGNPYESGQVMIDTWTIRIDPDNQGGWMLDLGLKARDWLPTTYTGGPGDRVTEVIKAPGTKVYVDSATIGSTQVTGKLISASVTGNNAIQFKAFSEDEQWVAANKVGRGKRVLTGSFVFEFDSDTEFANFRSTTPVQRFIRIEREGTQVHGASVVNKRVRLDMNGYWNSWAPGDRNGNLIATFGFRGFYNASAGYTSKMEVVNALATMV